MEMTVRLFISLTINQRNLIFTHDAIHTRETSKIIVIDWKKYSIEFTGTYKWKNWTRVAKLFFNLEINH
jgi:hypothetical protein